MTGACGAGPNIMLLPDKLEMRHVSTVSKMTDILREVCGFAIDDRLIQVGRSNFPACCLEPACFWILHVCAFSQECASACLRISVRARM